MALLNTVADMVLQARVLTQDKTLPYRYQDDEFLTALNAAVLESKKLRPDFWMFVTPPSYTIVDATALVIPDMYRMAFVYYMVGQAQMRDEEETQDNRAAGFLQMFKAQLVGL